MHSPTALLRLSLSPAAPAKRPDDSAGPLPLADVGTGAPHSNDALRRAIGMGDAPFRAIMIGELSPSEIEGLLRRQIFGRIGCYADGLVYVVPVNYVYDADSIYGQTGEGMKVRMMRHSPNVCFQVDQVEDIGNWRSAICWGLYEELQGKQAADAMDRLVARLMPVVAMGRSALRHHMTASSIRDAYTAGRGEPLVYRIRLDRKTGRFEQP